MYLNLGLQLVSWDELFHIDFERVFGKLNASPCSFIVAGNSTGEEESALSPPCSSYKIDSVAENEPLVNCKYFPAVDCVLGPEMLICSPPLSFSYSSN